MYFLMPLLVSAFIGSLLLPGLAVATVSKPTPTVVGHKPQAFVRFDKETALTGEYVEFEYTYHDIDGDIEDVDKTQSSIWWKSTAERPSTDGEKRTRVFDGEKRIRAFDGEKRIRAFIPAVQCATNFNYTLSASIVPASKAPADPKMGSRVYAEIPLTRNTIPGFTLPTHITSSYSYAVSICRSQNKRLPTLSELRTLYNREPNRGLGMYFGWLSNWCIIGIQALYWTQTDSGTPDGKMMAINLDNGEELAMDPKEEFYVTCISE